MVVGILTAQLYIGGANSLKDKRRVVKSLIDRIRVRHNVSIAEVDSQDTWRKAVVGVACVSNSSRHANSILSSVVDDLNRETEAVLADYSLEIV
ncbi:MAG TPA: DUF503 domain-containing protein [Firmicutes bacterium]|nr:DUF503 domain-containing protein [Bacillota bacterium]